MKGTIPTDEERKLLLKKIEKLRSEEGLSIHLACGKVGISEPSFYAWRKKFQNSENKKPKGDRADYPKRTPPTKIPEEDGKRILEIKAMYPHMGTKQLRLHLIRNYKITYSFRQVRQFLEYHDVPKIKTAFPPQPVRRFERDQANEMWQVDIMNFFVGTTSLYLTSFLDDYSRFIVSYQVTENQSSKEVLSLLRRAVSFRKPLSILSDRGIQFCSWNGVTAFQLELKALTIDHLLAREQHPETTGKIEAFHKQSNGSY